MPDYIVINDDLRTMTIPDSIKILGVESDDDVNKIPFQMPKEYCGFDLSQFSVRINYMNANGEGDMFIANDVEVDGDDPSLMTFTWLVGRTACAYKGNVNFIVCLKKFDDQANVVQEFNTTVYGLPVLEGLETTEAIVQENKDIIEYLINLVEQSGAVDPNNYYTKTEVNALIPTELPNPEKLTINGTEYDGSEAVDITVEATSEVLSSISGKIIHVVDAVPQAVESLRLYNSADTPLATGSIAVANKNLFRIDLLGAQVQSKGITFTKNADGSITCNGTSTGTYPMTSCNLDKNIFVVGKTYTISTGKTVGLTYVQLILNYSDGTTDYIVARNNPRSFTVQKEVTSASASVQLTDSGVTVNNEVVYPMIELSDSASAFVINSYQSMIFNGSNMPVLPASISNIWSNDDEVANISMSYEADTVLTRIDSYASDNIANPSMKGSLVATHDGNGTVMIGLG